MKHRQVTGPKSSFVCATASALALFGAYESISISSSSRPIKATTTGMNVGNQATWALFTRSYSFGLSDLLLICFSGNFCLSVWLAFVYYCSVDAPCGCCSSSGTLIWLLVVALCLKLWVIGVRSCWLNVLLSLASKLYEVGGACCFSVPSFASSFHLSILSMSMRHSFGTGLCFPSLQTVKPSKSVHILRSLIQFVSICLLPFLLAGRYPKYLESAALDLNAPCWTSVALRVVHIFTEI